jgi:O-antigen/teichoic acid export membrane protein
MMPFMLWFPTERFRHMRDADGGNAFFGTTAELFLLALVVASGGIYLAGPAILAVLAPDVAFDRAVLGLVLLSMVAIGMTHPLNVGLLKPGHTHENMYAIAAGIAVLAVAILPLTAILGPAGAALARLVGSLAFLAAIVVLSQRCHRVGFAFGRMALVVFAGAGLAVSIDLALPDPSFAAAIARAGLFGIVAAAAVAVALALSPRAAPLRAMLRPRP